MTAINPYLVFNGNTEEAFNFYKSVFGGEFITLMRFKDMPADTPGMPAPDDEGNKIMHVALPMGNGSILMGSDPPAQNNVTMGNNVSISINVDSREEADKIFNALSAGGQVTMPLDHTFWGAYFGMCTDKFQINWMVSHEENQKK